MLPVNMSAAMPQEIDPTVNNEARAPNTKGATNLTVDDKADRTPVTSASCPVGERENETARIMG